MVEVQKKSDIASYRSSLIRFHM